MARPLRIEYPGAFYHITSRGNERKNIYRNDKDRTKFLLYLKSAFLKYGAVLHAYCLMNNHYHLFMETPKGNLSRIMLHINGAYTNYFNSRHKRIGHLFQGRYKAILVEVDAYAGELSRYIHLNPVRASIADMPEKYKWSSYHYYAGNKNKPEWLRTDLILSYFDKDHGQAEMKYKDFVFAGLHCSSDSPLEKTVASTLLGGDDFIEFIKEKFLDPNKKDRGVPALRGLMDIRDIAGVHDKVNVMCNNDTSLSRKITIYLLHSYSEMKLKEIGGYFKIGDSAVSEASRQFSVMLNENIKLKKQIEFVRRQLKF